MRIFIGGIVTETNTFSPFPTGMSGFLQYGVARDTSTSKTSPLSGVVSTFRERGEADGHEVIETITCFAQPAGATVRAVYEELRDAVLHDLRAAGPIDVVLLCLHGAMVAQGYDDCEGDILSRVRAIVPGAVIGTVIDPHCHLTEAMVTEADVVVIVKEYPHIDFVERSHDLYDICVRTARGEIRPVAALLDTAMIGFYPTFDPPMLDIVAQLRAAEEDPTILTAGIGHGFPWGDVAEAGTRVLVYADGDGVAAAAVARRIADMLYAARDALLPAFPGIEESLDRARGLNGRVALGDFSDNAGGGAPSDSTFFLRALLDRGITDAAIGAFWDPLVAQTCAEAGVGATLDVRLGGKAGPTSGAPVDLTVEVRAVEENFTSDILGLGRQPMGRTVWLHSAGVDIVVCTVRSQVYSRDAFTGLGIDLTDKRLVVVKSSNHYQADFRPNSDHLWHVSSPGAMRLDFHAIPYVKRSGVYFPKLPDPWATHGKPEPRLFARPAAGSPA